MCLNSVQEGNIKIYNMDEIIILFHAPLSTLFIDIKITLINNITQTYKVNQVIN